jgi:DNA polymerase III subunit alpha
MLLTRSYSHYSLLSAIPKIPDLITNATEKGYSTICLTDDETGAGFVDHYESLKKQNQKGTIGTTLKTPNCSTIISSIGSNSNYSKIAVIAKNNKGYKQLCKLVSIALVDRQDPHHLTKDDLISQYTKDTFIVLCSNDHELIQSIRENNLKEAKKILTYYTSIYTPKDIIIEAINPLYEDDLEKVKKYNLILQSLAKEFDTNFVVSPAPRYSIKEHEEIFKVILATRDNAKSWDIKLQRDFHLPTVEELKKDFEYLGSEVFDTSDIESQIDLFIRTDYDKHANEAFFPNFPLNEGEDYNGRLIYEVYIGFLTRFNLPTGMSFNDPEKIRLYWSKVYPYDKTDELKAFVKQSTPDTSVLIGYPKDYWEKKSVNDYILRLELELEVITSKGYPSYFLVLADLMKFCRNNDIVTTTRGSAAGCIVGFLTGINTIDPLVYEIPFERFLNPMRPSAPDIDGDFADDKREQVIQYLTDTYGKENVTQIITFGTMKPRAAVRDIGRALGISYTKCDRLSKLIPTPPQGKPATFKWAMEISEELKNAYESDEEVHRIIELAKIVEGNYRHASVHAAGLVITPSPASDYAPLQWDSDHKFVISQYNMGVGEKIGHVKMDILGIRNLAILGNSIELAEKRHNTKINLQNIDLFDKKAFELLSKGRTMGLFQLSGPAMTRYLVDMEPNRVQDLMAMVALYRPGPMANIPDYIKRKKNPKSVTYITPEMENWMKDSYGILVYQDDLLYSVINLAGYDWGEADVFRKGVGKKIQSVLDSQHVRFVEGCVKKGMHKDKAEEIWDLFVPFAAYGFNKAHASSYGMVAYWTAYMKGEYTVEFMTALMSSESNKLDKIAEAINECKELNIAVLPPEVNSSYLDFTIENDTTIRYGLNSIKMLGVDVIKHLITSRNNEGKFVDLQDFLKRMSTFQGFNKRSLEALIWSGALDTLGMSAID